MVLALVGAVSVTAGTFTPDDPSTNGRETVTRSNAGLIALPAPIPLLPSEPVSQQLRHPVRVAGTSAASHDLSALVQNALNDLGYEADEGDALHRLLVQTLAEGQTDAYIGAVLNSALQRNEYAPAADLMTPDGALDTDRLLAAVLAQAKG